MSTTQLGDFAIFGFSKDPEGFLRQRLPARLGITPRTVDFGTAGHFFFYTSFGDVAESEEAIALKLGFVRSPTKSPLSAQQLLDQKIVQSPNVIDNSAFRGNALVACFSKMQPCFSVYQTIMAPLPLYYTCLNEGILCATDPRCLLAVLEQIQLNEDAVPMHFLFRFVPGPLTYFRDIWRLFPGQMLRWCDGDLSISLVQDLRLSTDAPTFDQLNSASVEAFYEGMSEVMGAYLAEIEESGHHPGNLLSGGVDSSILQLLINERLPRLEHPLSFSFAVRIDSFEFEIEYARHASELFRTRHTFCDIFPQDYPDLLIRTVETLGQPNLYTEAAVAKLALTEFLASSVPDVHYFFTGIGADGLHGMSEVKKLALFEVARRIPGSRLAFQLAADLLARWSRSKAHGLREVTKMLAEANRPTLATSATPYVPTNYVAILGDLEMPRRCFGDQVLLKAFDYRLDLEAKYLNSTSVLEKIQVIDLLTTSYEPALVNSQLFLAQRKRPITFYLDEDVVRMTMAFSPKIRFLKGLNTKPIQRQILTRKSFPILAKKKKGASVFNQDLYDWMKRGPLHEMVRAIDVPGFMSKADFNKVMEHPGPFLWNLLTLDIFQKRVLGRYGLRQ